MSTIGSYSLKQSLPKIQIGHEGMKNNGIQGIRAGQTLGDRKTSTQADGSNNKAKSIRPKTTRRNKAKLKDANIVVNPHPKIPKSKMKVGAGKLKKKPKSKRENKPAPKKHEKKKPQDKKTKQVETGY